MVADGSGNFSVLGPSEGAPGCTVCPVPDIIFFRHFSCQADPDGLQAFGFPFCSGKLPVCLPFHPAIALGMGLIGDGACDLPPVLISGIFQPDTESFHPFGFSLGAAHLPVRHGIQPAVALNMGGVGQGSLSGGRKKVSAGLRRRIRAPLPYKADPERLYGLSIAFASGPLSVFRPSKIAEACRMGLIINIIFFCKLSCQRNLYGFQAFRFAQRTGRLSVRHGLLPPIRLAVGAICNCSLHKPLGLPRISALLHKLDM